ncbi:MAG: hypothetical protein HN834_06095 [Rhodospirillaceae bacterium]|jgi:hypothetical protein|nr:hypothetical protein [Rhodospirillaceae bacterium]MBT7285013.1 hypothetical protein [Rhodospirillaceae bacterium]
MAAIDWRENSQSSNNDAKIWNYQGQFPSTISVGPLTIWRHAVSAYQPASSHNYIFIIFELDSTKNGCGIFMCSLYPQINHSAKPTPARVRVASGCRRTYLVMVYEHFHGIFGSVSKVTNCDWDAI